MKTIFVLFSCILMSTQLCFGQKKQILTDTIPVAGVCEQCKERIEDAAFIKGVKKADWDIATKKLVIIFDEQKTTLKKIETSIAKAGHDAGEIKALPADYKKLPSCCAYKDPKVAH